MELDEYSAEQRIIVSEFLQTIAPILYLYQGREVDESMWEELLALLILPTARSRRESAELALAFFEAQREAEGATGNWTPGEPRPLTGALFRKVMNQKRDVMRASSTSSEELAALAARAVKLVENGGRETMMSSVHRDDSVIGWARYDPEPPTCGFCMTMISRGVVYKNADTAGGRINSKFEGDGQFKFHDNCTCKVIAVRDKSDWPGRDQYLEAEKLWIEASRGAKNNKEAIRRLDEILRPHRYRRSSEEERRAA